MAVVDANIKVLNEREVTDALNAFAKKSGIPVAWVVADQLRLMVQAALKFAPPSNKGEGRAAVKTDLNKLFVPIDDPAVLNYFEEEFFEHDELPPVVQMNLDGNESEMKSFHERYRDKRSGRVKYKGRVVRKIGDMEFVNKMYVPGRAFKSYLKWAQRNVGQLKASWLPALKALSSLVGGSARYPAWLDKVPDKKGSYSINTMGLDGSGFMEAVNENKYASDKYDSYLPTLEAVRRQDILVQLPKRMKKIIKQFNEGRIMKAAA